VTIINVVSMSGGKDSTAMALLAIERGVENLHLVFADTGHEHQQTYDYIEYLRGALGREIHTVRADFTEQIAKKREYIVAKFFGLFGDRQIAGRAPDAETFEMSNISAAVDWARTARGGKQRDLIHLIEEQDVPLCSSQYGLCE
jgi:hypothetical protein